MIKKQVKVINKVIAENYVKLKKKETSEQFQKIMSVKASPEIN